MTFSVWVNLPPDIAASQVIYHGGNAEFSIGAVANGPVNDTWFSLKLSNGNWYVVMGSLTVNTWHAVTGVWSQGDTMNIYIDGALAAQQAVPDEPIFPFANTPSFIARFYTVDPFLRGTVDEVKVYDRALSASEVQELFATCSDADADALTDCEETSIGTNPDDSDTDADGCADGEETGTVVAAGGQRDPLNEWDFYDVNGTAKVDSVDIALVRSKFNQDYPPYDRSTGAASWAPGPPDGTVNAVDIGLARASFNHNCQAPP